jgi:hypothetical protein
MEWHGAVAIYVIGTLALIISAVHTAVTSQEKGILMNGFELEKNLDEKKYRQVKTLLLALFPVNFICCFIYFLPSLSGGTNWFVLLRNSAICPYAFGGSEKSGLILGAVEIVDSIVWFKVSSDVAVCGNKNNFIGSS